MLLQFSFTDFALHDSALQGIRYGISSSGDTQNPLGHAGSCAAALSELAVAGKLE